MAYKKGSLFFCEKCGKHRTKHNRKRHESLHAKCQMCFQDKGPRHNCWKSIVSIPFVVNGLVTHFLLARPLATPIPLPTPLEQEAAAEKEESSDELIDNDMPIWV